MITNTLISIPSNPSIHDFFHSATPPLSNSPVFLYTSPSSLPPSLHSAGIQNDTSNNRHTTNHHPHHNHSSNHNHNNHSHHLPSTNINCSSLPSPLPWAEEECEAIQRAVILTEEQYNRAQAGGRLVLFDYCSSLK